MMKKLLFYLVLMIFGITGVAGATFMCKPPICPEGYDYNIWYDVDPVYEELDKGVSVNVSFDIQPYNSTYDYLNSALTVFVFWGTPNSHYDGEYYYNPSGHTQTESIYTNSFGWAFEPEWLGAPALNTLENTGSLSLDFKAWWSDSGECKTLKLKKAYLLAKGCDNPVPEPATLLLMGSGLVAFAGIGRKKIFKRKNK